LELLKALFKAYTAEDREMLALNVIEEVGAERKILGGDASGLETKNIILEQLLSLDLLVASELGAEVLNLKLINVIGNASELLFRDADAAEGSQ